MAQGIVRTPVCLVISRTVFLEMWKIFAESLFHRSQVVRVQFALALPCSFDHRHRDHYRLLQSRRQLGLVAGVFAQTVTLTSKSPYLYLLVWVVVLAWELAGVEEYLQNQEALTLLPQSQSNRDFYLLCVWSSFFCSRKR